MSITITLIGGPTALIEIDGIRLLTDPTFDSPGFYQLPHVKLQKLNGPAINDQTQSFANTMEAIQPLISAIAVVISP
jgi:hypothetical protein